MTSRTPNPSIFELDRIPRPLLALMFVAACMVSCSIGMAARRPFIMAEDVRAENRLLAKQLLDLKYDSQLLERRVAELQTPEGRERETRSRGYLKPEETRLTFLP